MGILQVENTLTLQLTLPWPVSPPSPSSPPDLDPSYNPESFSAATHSAIFSINVASDSEGINYVLSKLTVLILNVDNNLPF